ncbi:hypothetical protein E2C01_060649 [Portunus trituberculatus]|uniref:Uncharacterized protein n=1 Tax=Portunus trituberculatus TaxID=210409 RepID=A0A5B7H1S1_PORTR|nr:hypothetical protein [Portunus trituberculatus]
MRKDALICNPDEKKKQYRRCVKKDEVICNSYGKKKQYRRCVKEDAVICNPDGKKEKYRRCSSGRKYDTSYFSASELEIRNSLSALVRPWRAAKI